MRIAIAGYALEASMFTELVSTASDFTIARGAALLDRYDFPGILGPDADGIDWVPVMRATGGAGGPIAAETMDDFVREIVDGIAAAHAEAPLDGVYLDWHGASHTVGRDHDEEDFIRAIREVVGPDAVLSMSMDPHGNFSAELAGMIDLATAHRHAPHLDNKATRERSIRNLVTVLKSGEKPLKAWVRVPVLLPGERTSTITEPGASVFLPAGAASEREGVLDAGIWVGFAWADEDRNAGAVLVTGHDVDAITTTAAELAQTFWDAREDFAIVTAHSGQWDEAMDFLATGPQPQVWIADAGDNVTAGGSGDVTYAIHATLAREDVLATGVRILFGQLVDPSALAAATAAGVGAVLDIGLGAAVDARFGAPVDGPWTVESLIEGKFGEGVVGAVLAGRGIHVAVHGARFKFTDPTDPTAFGRPGQVWFDMTGWDVVVTKNGYMFPGQSALAATEFLAFTPGGTDLDFSRLPFIKVERPIFPLDTDFTADLTPVLIPAPAV
ncbi:MAG: M81 family metallopeptidase [Actinobacteria bacterium]|nr:M81 family metallopeptidase [Actinomycetota bacterium]